MPESVEMPAPVSTTMLVRASRSRAAADRSSCSTSAIARDASEERAARPGGGRAARRRPAGVRARPDQRGGRQVHARLPGVVERIAVTVVRPARALVTDAWGGTPSRAATRSTWSGSSPCSSSVNATRRALRRAVGERRLRRAAASAHSACATCRSLGRRRRWRRFTGGMLRRTATLPWRSSHARSNCVSRSSVRTIGELLPSRWPRPSAVHVSATVSWRPSGVTVEAVGEVAEQEQRGGAERRQPERLDVARAGVVAERVDQGVGPGLDGNVVGMDFLRERCRLLERLGAGTRRGSRRRIPSEHV